MFIDNNDFCLYIERLKTEQGFDSYLETVAFYVENYSDVEYEQVIKMLNDKIIDAIKTEAVTNNLLKEKTKIIPL